jgi:hypothetical protein
MSTIVIGMDVILEQAKIKSSKAPDCNGLLSEENRSILSAYSQA